MKIEVVDPQGNLGCVAICLAVAICFSSCCMFSPHRDHAELKALRLAVQMYQSR